MALTLISSPRECGGLSGSLGEGRGCDLCALVFILKLASALQYLFITSCCSARVVACFLASLEEHGPDLRPFIVAKMADSSVIFGVQALSYMNLHQ